MKKLKLFLFVLVAFLILPFSVFAEEVKDDDVSINNEVNLYFFHGNGCPHCEDAQEWFKEIEKEYGDKFNLVPYEVWYNEENNSLMSAVAEARGEEADGVPYIVIGNQSWSGFDESYKDVIINKIESEYKQPVEERYDVMDYVSIKEESSNTGRDILVLLLILAFGGMIITGIIMARKNAN